LSSNADFETGNKNPILSKNPIGSPSQLGINQNVKNARYLVDSNGDLWTLLVQLGDWGTGNIYDDTITFPDQLGNPNAGVTEMIVVNRNYALNGASWDRVRTTDGKSHVAAPTASGNTAVWTPASGKKFRLMWLHVQLGGDATLGSAGALIVNIADSATNLFGWETQVSNAAVTGQVYIDEWIALPGNGILSAAANNVLNCNLSSSLTAGAVRVTAGGTEE
jgi:hypothetical protein